MWNNLFISYEINNSEVDQSKLTSAIESLGNSTQLHENCWYVNSPKNASEAADLMNRVVSEDDIVIVANTTTDSATWLNLEEKREIRLKQNWKR
ncbi:hypothetical protein [Candidatus Thiodiazotropha endoloripes]|uniref:hypothetical protein n=1 Tax=Candidatus Thiodiazotropha endoloripes TaxID=1818881 RepID=UPI0009030FED|nr:hypothetical protein [Candidatus Thiodiazotropha endoloripes]